jgi:hypothetical protein
MDQGAAVEVLRRCFGCTGELTHQEMQSREGCARRASRGGPGRGTNNGLVPAEVYKQSIDRKGQP